MHTVVIKREIVRKNRWVPRALYRAFVEAKRRHDEYYRSIANLWTLYAPLADTWRVYDNSGASPKLIAAGRYHKVIAASAARCASSRPIRRSGPSTSC